MNLNKFCIVNVIVSVRFYSSKFSYYKSEFNTEVSIYIYIFKVVLCVCMSDHNTGTP